MEIETSQVQETQEQEQEKDLTQDAEKTVEEKILELDSVPKFKYAGREWTPKDLQGSIMMQADYTRKTQAIAEERKYYENLQADLDAVKGNPALAAQFKSVYPEKFHNYLNYVAPVKQEPAKAPEQANGSLDPQFMERFTRIENELNERKIQAAQAEIDATFSKLSKQYPMADEEAVIARAQSMLEKGTKLTSEVWDGLWKSVHEKNMKLAEQFYSGKVNNQKQANAKGKDAASGGGTPGMAPKTPRTLKEASEMALKELEAM